MTQCTVMKWVENLENVTEQIRQAREEIEMKVREAAALNEKAAVIRNAAYMDSLKLESHIRTWWKEEEIMKAKKLAEIQ
ncbi:stable inheritance protein KleA [Massilia putida]|uniref:stable inheritance protein KleA n=1 Tax=Massilia putida TaxID=1141883 RepID=UPI0012EC081D|nr:stable inheritance protein KleA [Massilia putida]